jgi:hypothetical protein
VSDLKLPNLLGILDQITASSIVDLRYELKVLHAIEAWAHEQIGIKVGDRIVINSDKPSTTGGGWAAYHECLAFGQTGVVTDIHFNTTRKYWSAGVKLDKEWIAADQRGGAGRLDVPDEHRGIFHIPVEQLSVAVTS